MEMISRLQLEWPKKVGPHGIYMCHFVSVTVPKIDGK